MVNAELVLVLNANYEPINTCSLHRAIGLLILEKACLVENGRGKIHTANNVFPRPSIIRLQMMVNRPRPAVKLNRREILRRDNFTCQYCGKHTQALTIDHIIPRHLGGQQTWNNVVAACPACNHAKGGRLLSEAGLNLLHPPREPSRAARYVFGRYLQEYHEWEPYLHGW